MSIKTRIKKLEARSQPDQRDLERRVERVLREPHLISPEAHARILEILELCKMRKRP